MIDSIIDNHTAYEYGGLIKADVGTAISMNNVQITNTHAIKKGGLIYMENTMGEDAFFADGRVLLENIQVLRNTSS